MKRFPRILLTLLLVLAFSRPATAGVNINIKNKPYNAKGNGTSDDTAAIQKAIDYAAANGGGTITIPTGQYLTTAPLNLYGDGVSFVGETGAVIIVNHHFTGEPGKNGLGISLTPIFDPTPIYSPAPTATDGSIFITNGRGATALIEKATGGVIGADGFNELAPCEFIGRGPLLGTYDNAGSDEHHAHFLRVVIPCRNIRIENIDFDFADASGDCSIDIHYGQNIIIKSVGVRRCPTVTGGQGTIAITGSQNCIIEGIISPNIGIGLNSCRGVKVRDCDVRFVMLEESCIGNTIQNNTLRATGTIGIRTNDNGCSMNTFRDNRVYNASPNTGAIGLWEGTNNVVSGNICPGPTGSIWAGGSGNVIFGNVSDSAPTDTSGKNVIK